jgi:hypothetical protein
MPGIPDLVFGLVLITVLIGGRTGLLNDPGTLWHLRLGREILRTGDVPRSDMLTYTRDRVPWVDQSWAFDAGLALLVDRWGWTSAVVAASLGLAWLYGALARGLLRDGRTPSAAVLVAILATGAGAVHFLIRPHLLTLAFVLWTLRACQAQHERGGWSVAVVPPLMVAWANVHGGFLAGPLIVLTSGVGHAVSGRLDASRRRNLARFAAAFVLSCVATLANPYGVGLYRHVAGLLVSSGVTDLIDEYQPIPFGKANGRVVEWIVLGLVALPSLGGRRMGRYALAHTVVWLHLALGSIRHAPLFALAAANGLAELLDGLPLASFRFGRLRRGWSAWPAAVTMGLILAVVGGLRLGGFSPKVWPLEGLEALNRQPADARLFHEQDWGGMIEAQCRPPRRAFLDDRFELFGRRAILDYLDALQGGPGWDALRDRERIDLVWVRPERGLAQRLARDPRWRLLHRDAMSVLYKKQRTQIAVSAGIDDRTCSPAEDASASRFIF